MRRMLDKKELEGLGGGGAGEEIHIYSITIQAPNSSYYTYIAASKNDYKIDDKGISILDFPTNNTYSDLRKTGKKYAASGYLYMNDQIYPVYEFEMVDFAYPFQVRAFDPVNKKTTITNDRDLWVTIFEIL